MVLGTDNDPLGLNQNMSLAGLPGGTPVSAFGLPFLNSFNYRIVHAGKDSPSAHDAVRWDLIRTYRDVPKYSDAKILTLDPLAAIQLYYDQFQYTVNPDWRRATTGTEYKNCPQFHLSDSYTKPLYDASRSRPTGSRTFPYRYQFGAVGDSVRNLNPDLEPPGNTDRRELQKAALDLMERIYALRTDLHWVVDPNTGERKQGLMPPGELHAAVPPCTREFSVGSLVGPIMIGIISAIVPFGGWIALIPNTVDAINERKKLVDMMERLETLTHGAPSGIQALINRRQLDRQFTPAADAVNRPTDAEATLLAQRVGLHHPAMICAPDDPCPPARQKELLHGLIDEWNTNRLNARRAGYENWRNTMLAGLTPDWTATEWSKKLAQVRPFYTGDCRWDNAGVCTEGAAGFRAWAADTIPKLSPGPVPPAPRRNFIGNPAIQSGAAYDRATLDQTDSILRNTGWFLATNEVETLLNAVAPPVPVSVSNPPTMMPPVNLPQVTAPEQKAVTPGTVGVALAVLAILISS